MKSIEENLYVRLEMLRGVSAIMVLIDHTYSAYLLRFFGVQHPLSLVMFFIGMHAVIIFFLLSGYLITLSCKNNMQKNLTFNIWQYTKSRILRIYPPLLLSIIMIIVIYFIINYFKMPGSVELAYGFQGDLYIIREHFKIYPFDILKSLLMSGGLLNANGPLWSLYIEAKMYVLALFFYLGLFSKNYWAKTLYYAVVISLIYIFDLFNKINFTFIYAIIWCIGALAFFLRERNYLYTQNVIKIISISIFTYLVFLAITVPRFLDVGNPDNLSREGSKIMFALFYVTIIFFIGLRSGTWPLKEFFLKSSKFSYSLYLLHFPILLFGLSIFQGWMERNILISLCVSFLMSIFIVFAAYFSSIFTERKYFYTHA